MPPRFDLLVLGDVNPDLVLQGDVEPVFGQSEQLVDGAHLTIGGSGAIVACGAARLGLQVALCGVVGDDPFGRWIRMSSWPAGLPSKDSSSMQHGPPDSPSCSPSRTIAPS